MLIGMTVQVRPVLEHVVADDTQEPSQVVADTIFSGKSLENQNVEVVDTAT